MVLYYGVRGNERGLVSGAGLAAITAILITANFDVGIIVTQQERLPKPDLYALINSRPEELKLSGNPRQQQPYYTKFSKNRKKGRGRW